jgi:FkbM family methyltransferase
MINFSGISNQKISGQLLRSLLNLIPPNTVLPILQGKLRGKKWIVGAGQHGAWLGSYEYDKQALFQNLIRPGDVVLDLGSHSGFYSLLASILVGTGGKVFSFEPFPKNITYLEHHLELNRIQNVTLFQFAVSNVSGFSYFTGGDFTGHLSSSGSLKIETVSLDDLFEQNKIMLPTLIKLDIEGAEFMALQGAINVLKRSRPIIMLATHGTDVHHDCCQFLSSLGYRLESINSMPVDKTTEIIAYPN